MRLILAVILANLMGLVPVTQMAAGPGLTAVVNSVDASAFPWVKSYVTVANENGQPVPGLKAADFEVLEEGFRADRVEVTPVADSREPLAVVVVTQASGSVSGEGLLSIKGAATVFINGRGEPGPASLIAFSNEPKLVQPYTGDRPGLLRAVDGLQTGGNTALNDALLYAVEYASKSGVPRTIVALVADGNDNASKSKLEDGVSLARQRGVPVYTIGTGNVLDRAVLRRIAEATGGAALFAPTADELEQAYQSITDHLRNQYVVKYYSPKPKGAATYRLTVKVNTSAGQASAESAFTASPEPPRIRRLSLQDGVVLTDPVALTVDVEGGLPVTQIALEIDGRPMGTAAGLQSIQLLPAELSAGRHELTVKVTDEAGSSVLQRIALTVPGTAGWLAGIPRGAWIAGFLLLIAAVVAVSQALAVIRGLRARLRPVRCDACGAEYPAYRGRCGCWVQQELAEHENRGLGTVLLENGLISAQQLEECLAQSNGQGKALSRVLLDLELINPDQLSKAQYYLDRSTAMVERRRELLLQEESRRQKAIKAFYPLAVRVCCALLVPGTAVSLAIYWGGRL